MKIGQCHASLGKMKVSKKKGLFNGVPFGRKVKKKKEKEKPYDLAGAHGEVNSDREVLGECLNRISITMV